MQKLCHSEVNLPILTTMIQEDAMSTQIIHVKWDSHVIMIKNTLEE